MIAVIGLIMFAVSSYLALSKKMHLMVPFVVVPVIAGLFCPGGFEFCRRRSYGNLQFGPSLYLCSPVFQCFVRDGDV